MNYYTWLTIIAVATTIFAVEAIVRQVTSCLSLRNVIDRHEYAVVFLYNINCRADLKNETFIRLAESFDRLSQKGDYRAAGIAFLKGNIKEESINGFAHEYAIQETPAFLIFKKGQLCGSDQKRAVLYGFPIQTELITFIDEWIGVDVAQLAQEEAERREREHAEGADISINYVIAPGWGYYPPWYAGYYWDWPAYRPGFYGGFGHHWRSGGSRRHR